MADSHASGRKRRLATTVMRALCVQSQPRPRPAGRSREFSGRGAQTLSSVTGTISYRRTARRTKRKNAEWLSKLVNASHLLQSLRLGQQRRQRLTFVSLVGMVALLADARPCAPRSRPCHAPGAQAPVQCRSAAPGWRRCRLVNSSSFSPKSVAGLWFRPRHRSPPAAGWLGRDEGCQPCRPERFRHPRPL